MEAVMGGNVEPHDVVGMILVSWHNSISAGFIFVKMENKLFFLDGILWVGLEWKIREDNIAFSNLEVVDHSGGRNWDGNFGFDLPLFIEDAVSQDWLCSIIPEEEELLRLLINLWMR